MVVSMGFPAKGGFSFDLCARIDMLEKTGLKIPVFRKTGTTIVGLVFSVCLGYPMFSGHFFVSYSYFSSGNHIPLPEK
jgi:hypothetical protein